MSDDISVLQEEKLLPICVDLDGTLIETDSIIHGLISALLRKPWLLARLLFMIREKARFKDCLAANVSLEFACLPYRRDVLQYLTALKDAGHDLYLVSGTSGIYARGVFRHLGIFKDVYATDSVNLTGRHKAHRLNALFGEHGYIYAGNARIDLLVWQCAEKAIVVGSVDLEERARKCCPILRRFPGPESKLRSYLSYWRVC